MCKSVGATSTKPTRSLQCIDGERFAHHRRGDAHNELKTPKAGICTRHVPTRLHWVQAGVWLPLCIIVQRFNAADCCGVPRVGMRT